MTLKELKAQATDMGITPDDVRKFGHIGHKATWRQAIDVFLEWGVIDAAQEAQQPAQDTAETVCDALYSDTSRAIVQWIAAAVLLAVFTIGLYLVTDNVTVF